MTRQEILKNAKPILFNTDMVRAILDGRKTVTRRLIKPQPKARLSYLFAGYGCGKWSYPSKGAVEIWGADYQLPDDLTEKEKGMLWTPPCHTDDILYVRETWQYLYELDGNEQIIEGTGKYYYAATDTIPFDTYVDSMGITHYKVPWRPSIHMPKEAARIFLKVTNVRAERLQKIRYMDCIHEGVPYKKLEKDIISEFSKVWDSTIKKADIERYGWDANPWVWVIEFERIEVEE